MKHTRTGWGKFSQVYHRMPVIILGTLIFLGLILLPFASTIAQVINQGGTPGYMPIVLKNQYFGPTYTITPSLTPTVTGTVPTATFTFTPGPSLTPTYTPSPTFTGTLTPNPTITITVTPSQAKVNETFTFTITVKNNGTRATHSNVVVDNFPVSYIDVSEVSTTKGNYVKQSRSFIVTIGDINPNETVTIIAKVKVNSSLTATATNSNLVTLTYDDGASKTASVTYKVLYQALPGTGELPLNWRAEQFNPVKLIPGIVLLVLGGAAFLLVALWSKARDPRIKLWMTVGGTILVLVGFVVGFTASGLFSPTQLAQEYSLTPTSGEIIAQGQSPESTVLPHLPASAFSTPDSVIPIVTLPDYPIPTPVITITPQPGETGPDTSAITRIVIPALLLDTEVKYVPYDGFSWLITGLRQEVAWMGDTSWPGLGGNTGLAGHVTVAGIGDGPFRHLDELPRGELVLLYTEKNIYTYQVRDNRITDDSDMSVVFPTDNPQISLITCVDWDQENHIYVNRLVVTADLIRTEPITIGMVP